MSSGNYNPDKYYQSRQLKTPESYLAYDQSCTNEVHDFDSTPARSSYADMYDEYRAIVAAKVYDRDCRPEEYLSYKRTYHETVRSLSTDYRLRAGQMDRDTLRIYAQYKIDEINRRRHEMIASGVDESIVPDLVLDNMSDEDIVRLSEPDWSAVARGEIVLDEEQQAILSFNMKENIDELRILDEKLNEYLDDDEYMDRVRNIHREYLETMRGASHWLAVERRIRLLEKSIDEIYREASASRRQLTAREERAVGYFNDAIQAEKDAKDSWIKERGTRINQTAMKNEIHRRKNAELGRQFRDGFIMTESMADVSGYLLPDLAAGRPALLVGETGGAKTALAMHIARHIFNKEPEVVSASVEASSSQIIGKAVLRAEEGVPVSKFIYGPLLRAMKNGCPLILDEINAMPSDFLKRFNVIMQLRPGDKFRPQEDGENEIEVQPGFCIIATANEKSRRYRGVEKLSVEFLNRFGANVQRIHYPDFHRSFDDFPVENMQIAIGAIVNEDGTFPSYVDIDEIASFVRACFVTQQVFSGNQTTGFADYRSTDKRLDSRPGLEESVLAPRTMAGILMKYKSMFGRLPLTNIVAEYLDGVELAEDRQVMRRIMYSFGFLEEE